MNPIKDNRIISNLTFASRFKNFLEWIPKEWVYSQPHYWEEYQYMTYVADLLLNYQIETATTERETSYLERIWPELTKRIWSGNN